MQEASGTSLSQTVKRYSIAVWTVALAFTGTLLSSAFESPGLSPLFLLAVMVSAWRGGLGAGLFATLLSILVNAYALLPPLFSFSVEPAHLLSLLVFTFAAVIIGTLSSARRKAELELENLLRSEQAARIEAESANAVKDEFLATVSHELRTPLTTIKALTHVLLRNNATEVERREYLEDIASECDRQIDLVHNLLDLSRIKAGGVQLNLQKTNVSDILRTCEKINRFQAAEHGHTLSVESSDDLPLIFADRDALRRALHAIVENAIKYTPHGGDIRLRAQVEGGCVAIEVSDNGPGIHPKDLPHVFESFYRGHSRESIPSEHETDLPGIGLGLYLARALVQGMNGSIEARSGLEVGTTFTLRLPALHAGNHTQSELVGITSLGTSERKQQVG